MDADAVLFDLGRRVQELRIARGLTQDQFAELLSLDPSYLRRIEGGRINLGVRKLVLIAKLLGCASVAELFEAPQSRAVKPGRPRRKKVSLKPSGTSD